MKEKYTAPEFKIVIFENEETMTGSLTGTDTQTQALINEIDGINLYNN